VMPSQRTRTRWLINFVRNLGGGRSLVVIKLSGRVVTLRHSPKATKTWRVSSMLRMCVKLSLRPA